MYPIITESIDANSRNTANTSLKSTYNRVNGSLGTSNTPHTPKYRRAAPKTRFKNILATIDGSEPSHHALHVADTTLTIHHLLEATRQGHPTNTTLQTITQNPPNPTLAPTPPIPHLKPGI